MQFSNTDDVSYQHYWHYTSLLLSRSTLATKSARPLIRVIYARVPYAQTENTSDHGMVYKHISRICSLRLLSSVSTEARLTKGANQLQDQEGGKEIDEAQDDADAGRPGIGLRRHRTDLYLTTWDMLCIFQQPQPLVLTGFTCAPSRDTLLTMLTWLAAGRNGQT